MDHLIYPSCVVNLRLRFDETFRVADDLVEPGPQGGDPDATEVVPSQTGGARPPKVSIGKAFRETQPGDHLANTRPLITQTGTSNLSFVQNRIPKSATVELPGHRVAGKFSLEFDWRELPIDPRLIRSCGVEIYMGSVPAGNFSRGMGGLVDADGQRASTLTLTQGGLPREDMLVLVGNADNWLTTHNDGGSIVKMDGRDLRGLFLDSPVDPAVMNKLDLSLSLVEVVTDILLTHPAAQYMKVRWSPQDWEGGKPPTLLDKGGLTRVRRKADGESASGGSTSDDLSMWDLITRYCDLAGAVPYFRGRNLIIRPARSLYDESKPRFESAIKVFEPNERQDDDGNPFTERKMLFGRNIKELTFERKLSGVKVPVVEVVSFDTSSTERGARKMLIEQWPPKDEKLARVSGVLPSGEVSQTDKLVIQKPGIRDRDKLLGIAKSLYEGIGRGEFGGACTTSMVNSFKGTPDDPDLLRLRAGDQVEFAVDIRQVSSNVPNVSTLTDSSRDPFDTAVQKMKDSGIRDENLARIIVASARSQVVDLIRKFRVANVVFNWSLGSGIQIAFDFHNYFSVRYGITEQLGKNVLAAETETVVSDKAKRPKVRTPAQPKMKAPRRQPKVQLGRATGGG